MNIYNSIAKKEKRKGGKEESNLKDDQRIQMGIFQKQTNKHTDD